MPTLIAQMPRRRTASLAGSRTSRPLQADGPRAGQTHSDVGQAFLAMPFDAMRFQYASAAMAGLVPRSILGSAKSERAIDLLEQLILGPIARKR